MGVTSLDAGGATLGKERLPGTLHIGRGRSYFDSGNTAM